MDEQRAREAIAADSIGAVDLLHGGARGALAAMAMSGMRAFTVSSGIVEEAPPQAIVRQLVPGMGRMRVRRRGRRRSMEELFHWGYGAGGGIIFAALPAPIRRHAWSGPAYGLLIWLGFEAGIAPMLGLKQAGRSRPAERVALAVDHLLYGLVLSETRRRDAR